MAKSFFNSIQKQESQEPVSEDLTKIFTMLYQLPNRVQYCHHNTKSYAAHKALDKAYDALSDLKDSIVEELVGYSGVRPTNINLVSISGYSEEMNTQVADEIMAFGEKLEEYADAKDYCNIENLAQEYSGVGAQLKYLLSLK